MFRVNDDEDIVVTLLGGSWILQDYWTMSYGEPLPGNRLLPHMDKSLALLVLDSWNPDLAEDYMSV